MGDIIGTLIFFGLLYLHYKMFRRYIIPAAAGALILGIIGAICTDNGHWVYFAWAGAGIGLITSLIIDFQNAWRTVVGALVGMILGVIIGAFIDNNMWSINIYLTLALLGGMAMSRAALNDVNKESPKAESGQTSDDEDEEDRKKPITDALGKEHKSAPLFRCEDCAYFSHSGVVDTCSYNNGTVHGYDYACSSFRS